MRLRGSQSQITPHLHSRLRGLGFILRNIGSPERYFFQRVMSLDFYLKKNIASELLSLDTGDGGAWLEAGRQAPGHCQPSRGRGELSSGGVSQGGGGGVGRSRW